MTGVTFGESIVAQIRLPLVVYSVVQCATGINVIIHHLTGRSAIQNSYNFVYYGFQLLAIAYPTIAVGAKKASVNIS